MKPPFTTRESASRGKARRGRPLPSSSREAQRLPNAKCSSSWHMGKECWEIFTWPCAKANRAQALFSTSQNATEISVFWQ